MKNTVIIYASTHHGNTCRLVEMISGKFEITLIDATSQKSADLSGYDLIGFASGIDFGRFYSSVEEFLENNLPENKRVFFLYTCAKTNPRFVETVKNAALCRNSILMGTYGCRGYNTYGPWKLIGGMNKNHPSPEELDGAVVFFESVLTACK